MKLLIYGAGVIGCLYAALFSNAGYDTTIFARGKRLETLRKNEYISIITNLHIEDRVDYSIQK